MVTRKNPFNFGVIYKDRVLYSSDMSIAPVIDLAKFSISFADNLVNNAILAKIIHEPISDGEKDFSTDEGEIHVSRESVFFKFVKNPLGETAIVCLTCPSADDLMVHGLANLQQEQLDEICRAFLEAYTTVFIDATGFQESSIEKYTQEQYLKFHEIAIDLYEEALRLADVIMTDMYPGLGAPPVEDEDRVEFIFASVMHMSLPVASRFFETVQGMFKISSGGDGAGTEPDTQVIENLVSAQLSTIVSSARSIANTHIRQVRLVVEEEEGNVQNIYINFFPIKNDYSLVIISKGSPATLRFVTQATASILREMPLLDSPFSGEVNEYIPVKQVLGTIPDNLEGTESEGLDSIVDDMDLGLDVVVSKKRHTRVGSRKDKEQEEALDDDELLEDDEIKFLKNKKNILKRQEQINKAIGDGKNKIAHKKLLGMVEIADKIGSRIMVEYYLSKIRAIENLL